MTPAEGLALWTGRMGMRKAKGRRCSCWVHDGRCNYRGTGKHTPTVRPFCFPPAIKHASIWGLGPAPDFPDLRVLCSQPALVEIDEPALEEWCARQKLVCWERPELTWNKPGRTTLQVFFAPDAAIKLSRRDRCPGCLALVRWADRDCCGIGDLVGWAEAKAVTDALMGEEV